MTSVRWSWAWSAVAILNQHAITSRAIRTSPLLTCRSTSCLAVSIPIDRLWFPSKFLTIVWKPFFSWTWYYCCRWGRPFSDILTRLKLSFQPLAPQLCTRPLRMSVSHRQRCDRPLTLWLCYSWRSGRKKKNCQKIKTRSDAKAWTVPLIIFSLLNSAHVSRDLTAGLYICRIQTTGCGMNSLIVYPSELLSDGWRNVCTSWLGVGGRTHYTVHKSTCLRINLRVKHKETRAHPISLVARMEISGFSALKAPAVTNNVQSL